MKKLLIFILTLITVFAFAACGKGDVNQGDGTGNGEVSGFTWLETADSTKEIGTTYNMSGIWGKYGDKYIKPTITVQKQGGTVEFDAENCILPLYELGDYNITLEFKYAEKDGTERTVSKSFKVSSVDTTAPTIGKTKAGRIHLGMAIELDNTFTAYDSVDKDNVIINYTVVSPSGASVGLTDNVFIAQESGYYTVTVTAKDTRDNSATREYEIFVRDNRIFESFRIEDEAGEKGYSTDGRDFTITEDHAEGDGACLHFYSYKDYNHPFIKFENSVGIDWNSTNGLLFTVYNATASTVTVKVGGMEQHTDLWNDNFIPVSLEGNRRSTFYVANRDLARLTTNGEKYLYIEICYVQNGNVGFTTGQIELYFDDVLYATAADANEYTFNSVKNFYGSNSFTTSEAVKYNGTDLSSNCSLYFKTSDNWAAFAFDGFTNDYATDKIKNVTLWVYNPSETYDFKITVGYLTADDLNTTGYKTPYANETVTLHHGEWTKIVLRTTGWPDGDRKSVV